jgi:hypothetical protein
VDTLAIRKQVSAFLSSQENPVPRDIAVNMVLQFLRDHVTAGGTPYLADGAPVLLLPNGKIKGLTLENQEIVDFLHAAGLPLNGTWKRQLADTLTTGNLPSTTLRGISYYDERKHLLFLNEWDGHYLRIDGSGDVSRHTNGEFGLLFALGEQPHATDLTVVRSDRALTWTDNDTLIRHVLGVGVFSDSTGLPRPHIMNVLLAWILAVMMKDRVRTVPIPFLNGPSGSRKTAIAHAIGSVITPQGLDFRVVACPNNAQDTENVVINAHGIVALDEFQKAKELASTLKAITTGAAIKRRILYTTSKEQTFHVDAVPFLTVNDDVWADEATQKRLLRITMGQPGAAAGGWRGDFFIRRDWVEGRLRECAWNELVSRLAACMRLLTMAKQAGREDLCVNHRMSGFWSFILAIAEQEGPDVLRGVEASMAAVDQTQTSATEWSDDLLELLMEVLNHKLTPSLTKRWIKLPELRGALMVYADLRSSISPGLRAVLQSSFSLHKRLCGSGLYRERLGLEIRERNKQREYWFEIPEVQS